MENISTFDRIKREIVVMQESWIRFQRGKKKMTAQRIRRHLRNVRAMCEQMRDEVVEMERKANPRP